MTLKKNQIVNIYVDPETKSRIEGKAKLINLVDKEFKDRYMEMWNVKFIKGEFSDYKGYETQRWVVNPNEKMRA